MEKEGGPMHHHTLESELNTWKWFCGTPLTARFPVRTGTGGLQRCPRPVAAGHTIGGWSA